jgi:hypothetical protein
LLIAGITAGKAEGQTGSPPDIEVTLSLDKSLYLLDEPIMATLSLQNVGGDTIPPFGFKSREFHRFLTITDPEGGSIHADPVDDLPRPEPLPPPVIWIGDVPLQIQEVETVEAGWTLTDTFNVLDDYTLTKGGWYSVKAIIPMKTYPAVDHVIGGREYAEIGAAQWLGVHESGSSAFALVTDQDFDSYSYPVADARISPHAEPDCDDTDPDVHPGAEEVAGNGKDDDCNPGTTDAVVPGSLIIEADIHTVGMGNYPGSTKEPLGNLPVRIYDNSPGSCASLIGVSWQNYKSIWLSCYTVEQGVGVTDGTGEASFTIEPGNYLAIGQYDAETYIGRVLGILLSGEVKHQYLQVIVKASGEVVPAKYTVRTGSELLIIEPDYVEWSGTEELYPFVFESIGDWAVTTAVSPPEGFVADHSELEEQVNTELEAVQFTITDVGSTWDSTGVVYTLKHKGKTEKVKSRIGIKCAKKLAKKKGFDSFCKKGKVKK